MENVKVICEAVVTITTTADDRRWQKWWSPPPVIDCPPYKNSGSQKSPFCHTSSDRYTTNGHHLHRNRVPWSPNALSFFLPSFVCFLFNKSAAGQGNVPVFKMARTFNHNCRRRCCDQSNWQELLNRFCRRLFVCVHIHTLTNRQMTTTILSRPLHTSSLLLSYWVFLFSVSVCPATAAAAIITHFGSASLISSSFRCLPKKHHHLHLSSKVLSLKVVVALFSLSLSFTDHTFCNKTKCETEVTLKTDKTQSTGICDCHWLLLCIQTHTHTFFTEKVDSIVSSVYSNTVPSLLPSLK